MKRSSVELRPFVDGVWVFFFVACNRALPNRLTIRVLQFTEHKIDSRLSNSFPRNPAGATHDCPASIRTLNGPLFWARCMLGFDLKPRSHHQHGDGTWVVRGCHLRGGLLDPCPKRSLPNKAVDVIACKLSGDRWFSASSTRSSVALGCCLSCPFRFTQPPFAPSPSRRRSPVVHRPRHSPRVDAARPPTCALPLPRLAS